jgi:AAA domain
VVGRQVELVALELHDFRCFGGVQRFEFEPPTADGRSGITVITGWGASGKTALVDAIELALWGVHHRRPRPRWWGRALPHRSDALREPQHFINCETLQRTDGEASVTLTMRVLPAGGPARTMELKRAWTQLRDGWLDESIEVLVSESGRVTKLAGIAAQRAIEEVLPSGRPPLVLTDCEEIDMISRLASIRHDEREMAENTIAAMVGAWPEEMWREVAAPVIKAANHMLLALDGPSEILLLPEQAGRRWDGAYPIAPGIWSTDETMGARRLTCIGLALVLGPHLAGEVSAPLVLDAPVNRMEPGVRDAWLDALAEVEQPQVILTTHECLVEYPALTLLDRVRWFRLVQLRAHYDVHVLDEAALIRG